jgi:hypothetical protein
MDADEREPKRSRMKGSFSKNKQIGKRVRLRGGVRRPNQEMRQRRDGALKMNDNVSSCMISVTSRPPHWRLETGGDRLERGQKQEFRIGDFRFERRTRCRPENESSPGPSVGQRRGEILFEAGSTPG